MEALDRNACVVGQDTNLVNIANGSSIIESGNDCVIQTERITGA